MGLNSDRVRVNVSFSGVEYLNLQASADILGVSPTRAAYLSIIEGLPLLVKKAEEQRFKLNHLRAIKNNMDVFREEPVKRGRGRPKKAAI